MRKVFLIIILLFTVFRLSHAESYDTLFLEANKTYANGEYEKAKEIYLSILSKGIESGSLYFNIGNTYFKTGHLGKALVYYSRAKRFIGYDEDLRSNTSYCLSLLNEAQPSKRFSLPERIYRTSVGFIVLDKWALMTALIYAAFVFICVLRLMISGLYAKLKTLNFSVLIIFLLCITLYGVKIHQINTSKQSIVISDEVDVRYSPSFKGGVGFKIYEGFFVDAIREDGDWVLIRLEQNKSGWVPADSIEYI